MHKTTVKFKDGRELSGYLSLFRPAEGFMTLGGEKVFFSDVVSATTEDPRPGETGDELDRARKYLADARKFGWEGKDLPVQDWED